MILQILPDVPGSASPDLVGSLENKPYPLLYIPLAGKCDMIFEVHCHPEMNMHERRETLVAAKEWIGKNVPEVMSYTNMTLPKTIADRVKDGELVSGADIVRGIIEILKKENNARFKPQHSGQPGKAVYCMVPSDTGEELIEVCYYSVEVANPSGGLVRLNVSSPFPGPSIKILFRFAVQITEDNLRARTEQHEIKVHTRSLDATPSRRH